MNQCPHKKSSESSVSFSQGHVNTQQEGCSLERGLSLEPHSTEPWASGLQNLRNTFLLFKPPSLRSFVMAAGTDESISEFVFYCCHYKLPQEQGFKTTQILSYSPGGQKPEAGLTGLKSRCRQSYISFSGSLPVSSDTLHPLVPVLVPPIQNQPVSV